MLNTVMHLRDNFDHKFPRFPRPVYTSYILKTICTAGLKSVHCRICWKEQRKPACIVMYSTCILLYSQKPHLTGMPLFLRWGLSFFPSHSPL